MELDFQSIAAIIFLLIFGIGVYLNRSKLEVQKILGPFLYIAIYRTKVGLDLMNAWAKRWPKTVKFLGYVGIWFGFIGMVLSAVLMVYSFTDILSKPDAPPAAGLVLPIQAKGVIFVPFFYWIISIFVVLVVHEFAHGLIARAHNIKVKSSGLAFLGALVPIIPGAFVEPDEKSMKKRPARQQLSVFAAGPFANFITAFVFALILNLLLAPVFFAWNEPSGVLITGLQENGSAMMSGIPEGAVLTSVDNAHIDTIANLSAVMATYRPGETVKIGANQQDYLVTLGSHPDNDSIAYIGIFLTQHVALKEGKEGFGFWNDILIWFYGNPLKLGLVESMGLIGWIVLLNFGIGLFNLLPVGPLDGGRMARIPLVKLFGEKRGFSVWKHMSLAFAFVVLAIIMHACFF